MNVQNRIALAFFRRADAYELIQGITAFAAANPAWRFVDLSYASTRVQVETLKAWDPQGLIVHLQPTPAADEVDFLRDYHGKIVNLNHDASSRVPVSVFADPAAQVDAVYLHLRELSVTGVAAIGVANRVSTTVWEEALRRRCQVDGLAFTALPLEISDESLLIPARSLDDYPASLLDAIKSLPQMTGIVCTSDFLAWYVVSAAIALGRMVPENLPVTGAGNYAISGIARPSLTSVKLPLERIGHEAASLLDRMVRGDATPSRPVIVQECRLIVRQSTSRYPADIRRALRYIEENATSGLTVSELVERTQEVSRVTFERRFKLACGKTPAEEIRRVKVDNGLRMLRETEMTVASISLRSGFDSLSQFAASIKKAVGTTPSDYRRSVNGSSIPVSPDEQEAEKNVDVADLLEDDPSENK